ncbi:unnamed protein product [Darwinula stevensoni]|uniref:Ion transport domain-containing protein n=1 Tax=Darwinula stevensoni TaxID=69355 RepID=A0A7R8ZYK6_9CRUS|nr:unnamed protein product [Darwinula stevensoni]CAG0881691.1 unnamed protein product [Darwinula stevensoni]
MQKAAQKYVLTEKVLDERLDSEVVIPIGKDLATSDLQIQGEICLMQESPFRIIKMGEVGNLKEFQRLYTEDPKRLGVRDSKGRTAAHAAAARNHVHILAFIRDNDGDLNAQDVLKNTPLHDAVEKDALDAIDFLIESGVATDLMNTREQAPIHLAVALNKPVVLQRIVKHKDRVDIHQGGEHGRTPLHLAAIHDYDQCAQVLLEQLDHCPRKTCRNGFYPIHEAARHASSRTLKLLLNWGEKVGCSRERMIAVFDAEGNVPLHSAVHAGDIKAVRLCLMHGAKISTQQHDLSTPVHLACSQGALDIVQLMFSMQPQEKEACLAARDAQEMTPLHCAAMFDHRDIVQYLVSLGAWKEATDREKRTPLLLAAQRSCWRTVRLLLRLNVNIIVKDAHSRNILHLIIASGGQLEEITDELQGKPEFLDLLNDPDEDGCTPLHFASREGRARTLAGLLKYGAAINSKNNSSESPLHFAARYGRFNTVRRLLDSEKGPFIINESDGTGQTPLHISSKEGHTRLVALLLNRGALLHRDHGGRTPLHLAAMNGYTKTMALLLSVHAHLLNQLDKNGNTALHLAAIENRPNAVTFLLSAGCKLLFNNQNLSAMNYCIKYKLTEPALAMVTHSRQREVMGLISEETPSTSMALIEHMPRVFEAVLDTCIERASCKQDSKSYFVKYNFYTYQVSEEETMVRFGRVDLLAHPLSQKYLQMKWNSYGMYFHVARLVVYLIFLACVTAFVHPLISAQHDVFGFNQSSLEENASLPLGKELVREPVKTLALYYINAVIILVYVVGSISKEFIQMYIQRRKYLREPTNLVQWILFLSAAVMVTPVFCGHFHPYHFVFAALAVFLAWFNLLLYLQRFDQVGIYVVMFLEILNTLLKVMLLFSILIVAFGFAFYILLFQASSLYPPYSLRDLSLPT